MGQRYTPSQLQLIVDDSLTPGLFPAAPEKPLSAIEMNTLIVAAEFAPSITTFVTFKPWINIRSKDTNGDTVDNWFPMPEVTISSEAPSANEPPVTTATYLRGFVEEVALPNCHEVLIELIGTGSDVVNLWAATANRAPR